MDGMAKTDGPKRPAQEAVDRLLDRGFLDELMDRVDEGISAGLAPFSGVIHRLPKPTLTRLDSVILAHQGL